MVQIRVLIADDHAMFREGIRQVLVREKEIDSSEEAGDIRQAERLTMKLKPDVLLLDSSVLIDLQSLRKILNRSPASRILVLTEEPTGWPRPSARSRRARSGWGDGRWLG